MKRFPLFATLVLLMATGCAGFPLPFTEYRPFNWQTEINRHEVNSTCTDLQTLSLTAAELEAQIGRAHV